MHLTTTATIAASAEFKATLLLEETVTKFCLNEIKNEIGIGMS